MKKSLIYILCFSILSATVFSLAACSHNTPNPDNNSTSDSLRQSTKMSTSKVIEIDNIPNDKTEIVSMFNAALDYVDVYCYNYTKNVSAKVSSLNIGSLANANNAEEAIRSIFDETDVTNEYDYKTDEETFSANFIASGFEDADFATATAEKVDNNIVLALTFPDESNPTNDSGNLHKLGGNHQTSESITASLADFKSSASAIAISAYNIAVIATIDSTDSRLVKLEVSYVERYTLSGVKLVQLDGGAVTGSETMKITYTEIG